MIVREAKLEDVGAIARVQVNTWRTTYRGIIPEDYLANLSYEKREKSWVQILMKSKLLSEAFNSIKLLMDGKIRVLFERCFKFFECLETSYLPRTFYGSGDDLRDRYLRKIWTGIGFYILSFCK